MCDNLKKDCKCPALRTVALCIITRQTNGRGADLSALFAPVPVRCNWLLGWASGKFVYKNSRLGLWVRYYNATLC